MNTQTSSKPSGLTRAQRLANGPGPYRVVNKAKAAARKAGKKQFLNPDMPGGTLRWDPTRGRFVVGTGGLTASPEAGE